MIKSRDKVREAFAGCSDYYESKAEGVCAYDAALEGCGYHFEWVDCPGDSGSAVVPIYDDSYDIVGHAYISWYRMDSSGRYEFVGYIT